MGDINLRTKVNNLDEIVSKLEQSGYLGKNLLNSALETATLNGVSCINNGDGTYTFNGTATKNTTFIFDGLDKIVKWENGKKYKLLGCPSGGGDNTYQLVAQGMATDIGQGNIFTCDITKAINTNKFYIVVFANAIVNNLVFKPMITTDLYATNEDFMMYVKNNVELTSDLSMLIETLKSKGVID